MSTPPTEDPPTTPSDQLRPHTRVPPDEGGDPACWLNRVCPTCGRIAEQEPPIRCSSCGAILAAD